MTESVARPIVPIRLTWELKTPASLDETWAAFSDTDRFNRAANMGFRFDEQPLADGSTKKIGRMKRMGLNLAWLDLPFQYRTPEWFRKVRRFENGPAQELVTALRLRPDRDGTSIRYTIEVYPRSLFTRPLVWLEMQLVTRAQLQRTLDALMARLAGKPDGYDPAPPALPDDADRRLKAASAKLKPPKLGNALAQYIRTAPLQDQDRLLPLRLARRWEIPDATMLEGFLQAVQEGILTLRWDVICPSCRAPKARAEKYEEIADEVHCPSCNIKFDAAFPESLEVSFRPSPNIRRFEVDIACLGSPGRQPHIVAQDTVEPHSEIDFTLPLAAGPYRIRSWPQKEPVSVEVREGAAETSIELVANVYDLQPARVQLQPGNRTLKVKNVTDRPVEIILEKHWRPSDLLTAGRLLELPRARELLPGGFLPSSFQAETYRAAVLAIEAVRGGQAPADAAFKHLEQTGPRRLQMANKRIVAVYNSFREALAAARTHSKNQDLRLGLSVGTVFDLKNGPNVVAMGVAVDEALAVKRNTPAGVVGLQDGHQNLPEVGAALIAESVTVIPASYQLSDTPPTSWLSF